MSGHKPFAEIPRKSDDYFRKLAQNLILQAHSAIKAQDFVRAHQILEDLSYVFVGKGPGMIEVYEELRGDT